MSYPLATPEGRARHERLKGHCSDPQLERQLDAAASQGNDKLYEIIAQRIMADKLADHDIIVTPAKGLNDE